ncbi:MAG: HepT-like ribonuclease domain-containing protein [Bryobacteraceae bacterium]
MPSEDPTQRFEDILENIVLIEKFTAGMDLAASTEDPKTINAVERCLERISEAARKLGGAAEELCPAIPWPQLRAMGNFLRHE